MKVKCRGKFVRHCVRGIRVCLWIQFVLTSSSATATDSEKTQEPSSQSSVEDLVGQTQAQETISALNSKDAVEMTCAESKVSYEKRSMRHRWLVKGLADYVFYLEKFQFQTPFELSSQVSFHSTPYNGTWKFKLMKVQNSAMELRASYIYETQKPTAEKMAFDIEVTLGVEDDSVQLPQQLSTQAANTGHSYTPITNTQERSPDGNPYRNPISFTEFYEWTHIFIWSDIQIKLQALTESSSIQNQDVELSFLINSYITQEPQSLNISCEFGGNGAFTVSTNEGLEYIKQSFTSKRGLPPFYDQLNSIMTDDKYADLIIKSGDEEYKVHRIIFANSSPVFATMVFNKTFDKNESLIDLGEEVGSDVIEDIIQYIYTGKVDDVEEIADRLIVAAHKYGLPNLKKFCEVLLIQQVRMSNAFTMYALGDEVASPRLRRKAFNVMKENKAKIVAQSEEFRKLSVHYPTLMYELFLS